MIEKLCKKTAPTCNLDEIRLGNTTTMKRNLDALPYLLENAEAQGKYVNVSGFLNNNAHLNQLS